MTLPNPEPGLVIRYSYLWKREAAAGHEEGSKDRPCAIVATIAGDGNKTRVIVLPITHSTPDLAAAAVEIPQPVKLRLGLDEQRSWVILSEANQFVWPGPDLRPLPGQPLETIAIGFMPPRLFNTIVARFRQLRTEGGSPIVLRTE